jgi:hypothetical protein
VVLAVEDQLANVGLVGKHLMHSSAGPFGTPARYALVIQLYRYGFRAQVLCHVSIAPVLLERGQ